MIAVRLEGRLGNQLFQYAFIYATAKKLKVDFYIDQSIDKFLLDQYFEVDNTPYHLFQKYIFNTKGYKNLFSYHLKRPFYTGLKKIHQLKTLNFSHFDDPDSQLSNMIDSALYTGFFQSEQYFSAYRNDIIRLFSVKPQYKHQYKSIAAAQLPANKPIVVIHIRRGDYVNLDCQLPDEYYHDIIAGLKDNDAYYVFISDEADYIKEQFAYLENKYISHNTEIIDFQLLLNADVCILSSSSFSWWAAWLNPKKNKLVYAPKYWLGFKDQKEFPTGITKNLNWILV
jgi:hypothetical protein